MLSMPLRRPTIIASGYALEALVLLPAADAPALALAPAELFSRLRAHISALRHLSFYRENDTP